MPRGLYRIHHSRTAHFITFTCYHRHPHLADPAIRDLFVQSLERTRALYRMKVYGFVVMPEHVHLLISEPERGTVANAIQSLKIASAKRGKRALPTRNTQLRFWQKRYYDRNESEHKEFIEKLRYIHRNPGSPTSAGFALAGVEAREAKAGGETGGLEMEQLSPPRQRRELRSAD